MEIYDGDYIESDLSELSDGDLIDVFLTELAETASAVDELTKWPGEHNSNPIFETEGITYFQNLGYNLYRIKPRGRRLSRYRVIFAYDSQRDNIYFLAVVERKNYDYKPDEDISKRVFREYYDLGLPRTK